MIRIASIPVLAFALAMSATTAASASDIAVTLMIEAEADATLFAMAGNKIVWKSGDLGDLVANVPHPVPSEVNGVRIMTRNEMAVAGERAEHWHLYRVHQFAQQPRVYTVRPPLEGVLNLNPETWRASPLSAGAGVQ